MTLRKNQCNLKNRSQIGDMSAMEIMKEPPRGEDLKPWLDILT